MGQRQTREAFSHTLRAWQLTLGEHLWYNRQKQ
jgi:hypothetical protein